MSVIKMYYSMKRRMTTDWDPNDIERLYSHTITDIYPRKDDWRL
jgi:hypothetical protein